MGTNRGRKNYLKMSITKPTSSSQRIKGTQLMLGSSELNRPIIVRLGESGGNDHSLVMDPLQLINCGVD